MDAEEFVTAIRRILESGVTGLLNMFRSPPGRHPSTSLQRISAFYNTLGPDDRGVFDMAVEVAVKSGIESVLLVLDESLAIEDDKKGKLELFYNDGVNRIRLNNPDHWLLSDLFRAFE